MDSRDCDHDHVVRVERVPPPRQAGPYVRWYCQRSDCMAEFTPVPLVGRVREWFESRRMRMQLAGLTNRMLVVLAVCAFALFVAFKVMV